MTAAFADIPVFTYHKITERREFGINTVHPSNFEKHLQFFKESGYRTITFHDIVSENIPDKPLIITFDDGYASVYENALPLLKSSNFTAVVFIVSGYIGRENTWDANLGGITFPHLKADQIRSLSQEGMEIGSHGASHRALSYLKPEEIRQELQSSREQLSKLADKAVITLAYPFGIQNGMIRRIASEVGYRFGCINLWGKRDEDGSLCLRRIPVYGTDTLDSIKRKFRGNRFHLFELLRLKTLSWPALLTPMYQEYIKKRQQKEFPV